MRAARRDTTFLALLALLALLAATRPHPLTAQAGGDGDDSTDARAARARQPDAPTDCRRCLNGHRFLFSPVVPDPFITTHFRSGTGGGFATNLTVAVRNIEGEVVDSIGGDIGFLALDFEYAYAFTHWLALRTSVTALGRVGTNAQSILASGASALYGASFGATGRVWGSDAVQVSLTADARRNQAWVVDPYRYAQAVAAGDTGATARAVLISDVTANRYTGGVRAAWAPLAWLGLNALFEAGIGEDPNPGGGNEGVTEYGVLADVDSRPLWGFPLGVTLGYRGQSGAGRVSDVGGTASTYTMGFLYTGRSGYLIGLDGTWSRVDVEEPGVSKLDLVQARLITRFDF
jgi:hypothetical protein